jgi:hypothetical protein
MLDPALMVDRDRLAILHAHPREPGFGEQRALDRLGRIADEVARSRLHAVADGEPGRGQHRQPAITVAVVHLVGQPLQNRLQTAVLRRRPIGFQSTEGARTLRRPLVRFSVTAECGKRLDRRAGYGLALRTPFRFSRLLGRAIGTAPTIDRIFGRPAASRQRNTRRRREQRAARWIHLRIAQVASQQAAHVAAFDQVDQLVRGFRVETAFRIGDVRQLPAHCLHEDRPQRRTIQSVRCLRRRRVVRRCHRLTDRRRRHALRRRHARGHRL